jgi:hypothetical protein
LGEGGYQKEKCSPLAQSGETEDAKKLREVGSPRANGERGWGVRGSA